MSLSFNSQKLNKRKNRFLKSFVSAGIVTAIISSSFFSAYAAEPVVANLKSVSFKESTEYIVNPFMGDVAHAEETTRYVDGKLVVASYTWDEIEKTKGKIDFSAAESRNNYDYWINQKDNQLMLIFHMDLPLLNKSIGYDQLNIPKWLYDELKIEARGNYQKLLDAAKAQNNTSKINEYTSALDKINNDQTVIDDFNRTFKNEADIPGVGTFYRYTMDTVNGTEYRGGFSPNYASPLLLSYHNKVMDALAKRYDNDNTFAMVMGSVGHWGEMHTYYINGDNAAGRYPVDAIASKYEQAYADKFHNVNVSLRVPRKVARDNNFGLHVNAFGDNQSVYDWYVNRYQNGYTDYYTGSAHPAMRDFWKTAPSGGEFLYTGDQRFLYDKNIENTIQQAKDVHLSWFNEVWYYMTPETTRNQEYFYSKIGYRFVIQNASFNDSVNAGEALRVDTKWKNAGTAPFYKDWDIRIELRDKFGNAVTSSVIENAKNIHTDNQYSFNTNLNIPSDLAAGSYDMYIGIFNPHTNKPEIKLAIQQQDENNMYKIGSVNVQASGVVPPVVVPPVLEPPVVVEPPVTQPPVIQPPVVVPPVITPPTQTVDANMTIYGANAVVAYDEDVYSQYSGVIRQSNGPDFVNENMDWSVKGVKGVSVDSKGLLKISSTAENGTAILTATMKGYPGVTKSKSIDVKYYKERSVTQPPVTQPPVIQPPVTQPPVVVPPVVTPPTQTVDANITIYGINAVVAYDEDVYSQYSGVIRQSNGPDFVDKNIIWSVKGVKGVSVDSKGLLKISSTAENGTAILTATMKDHPSVTKSKNIDVKYYKERSVVPQSEPVEQVKSDLPEESYSVTAYGSSSLLIYPEDITSQYSSVIRRKNTPDIIDSNVMWSVSGLKGISIDSQGLLKVSSEAQEGTAIITVVMKDNSKVTYQKKVSISPFKR